MNGKYKYLHDLIRGYIKEHPNCSTSDIYYYIMDKPARQSKHFSKRKDVPTLCQLSGILRFNSEINVVNANGEGRYAEWTLKDSQ